MALPQFLLRAFVLKMYWTGGKVLCFGFKFSPNVPTVFRSDSPSDSTGRLTRTI